MGSVIERHIVLIGDRAVHYRTAGSGAPLLLFHQSPKTSSEMIPLIKSLSDQYQVIAPDTPGYGLSDPLPAKRPTITDLADGVVSFMTALGIQSAYLYGIHTGAKVALGVSARHPGRVKAVIADGILVNSRADRQDLAARYLPPFEAQDDGSHLMHAWHRMREQRVFFPWYNRKDSARMPIDVGDAESLNAAFMDFLASSASYSKAYGAALGLNIKGLLPLLRVPTLITCGPHDVLLEDVKALQTKDQIRIAPNDGPDHLIELIKDHFDADTGPETDTVLPVQSYPDRLLHATMREGMHGLKGGSIGGTKIFIVPELGGTVWSAFETLAALAPFADILALDPIGFGWSESKGNMLERLVSVAADWGADVILGLGSGAHLAAGVAEQCADGARLIVSDPLTLKDASLAQNLIPDLTPSADGAHIMAAWWVVRESQKFLPWTSPTHQDAIPSDGKLIAADLHLKTTALLNGWETARGLIDNAAAFDASRAAAVIRSDWALSHPRLVCKEDPNIQIIRHREDDLALSILKAIEEL